MFHSRPYSISQWTITNLVRKTKKEIEIMFRDRNSKYSAYRAKIIDKSIIHKDNLILKVI